MKCAKCGGYIDNGFRGCTPCNRKKARRNFWVGMVICAIFVFAAVGIKVGYAAWAYDDWTCGFKSCLVVK